MSSTRLRGKQILDGDIMRDDLNVTLAGQAVTRKILAGTNIGISYTGADVGTGDVTVNLTGTVGVANGGTGATSLTGILVGNGTSAVSAIVGTANQLLRRNAGNTAYEFFTPNFASITAGTVNVLPKYTSASGLGPSNISDSGTLVTISSSTRIDGPISQGIAPASAIALYLLRPLSGGTQVTGIVSAGQIQSDATFTAWYNRSISSTQAAVFTLNSLHHYTAVQGTFGSGSIVTNQYGYSVDATMIGATNNYAFWGNLAAGTGRWNLYMIGTANNYLGGRLGLGTTGLTSTNVAVSLPLTGNANPVGVGVYGQIQSDATTTGYYFFTSASTQAATFTTNALHYTASQGTFGAGSTVTSQIGFLAASSLIGAVNNYGFAGQISAGPGRWNLYMNGTANNHMAGNLLLGTLTDAGFRLDVNGTARISGNLTTSTISASAAGTVGLFTDTRSNIHTLAASFKIQNNADTSVSTLAHNLLDLDYAAQASGVTGQYVRFLTGGTERVGLGLVNDDFVITTAGTSRLTVTQAGNMGLNIIPSAWNTAYRAVQIGGSLSLWGSNNTDGFIDLASNVLFNGSSNYVRLNTGFASDYYQQNGQHVWRTAVSAAAGSPISFTTAMTLTATGNLLVGTATDNTVDKLQVNGSFVTNGIWTTSGAVTLWGNGTTKLSYGGLTWGTGYATVYATTGNDLLFGANGPTTKVTLKQNGNFLLNTTTDNGARLQVNGITSIQGTTATDGGQLGTELLTSANWTSTGWTGDFATGFTHTTGNTTALSNTLAAVANTLYQLSWTVTNRTAGSFTVSFGGYVSGSGTTSSAIGPRATSTANLVITPTTDFNGTIVMSIRVITAGSASVVLRNSAGTITNELRAFTANNNYSAGVSALRSVTTGIFNTATGTSSLTLLTSGINNSAYAINSLTSLTIGSGNSGFGVSSLAGLIIGSNNTAAGINAGRYTNAGADNTSAQSGVYIGLDARASAATNTNEIVIGADSRGNGSNTVTIGNSSITNNYFRGIINITRTGLNGAGLAGIANIISDGRTANDAVALGFSMQNSSSTEIQYGRITTTIISPTAGAHSSRLTFNPYNAGAVVNAMAVWNDGAVTINGIINNGVDKLQVTGSGLFTTNLAANKFVNNGVGTFSAFTADGQFQIFSSSLSGVVITGRGSTNDINLANRNGANVLTIPTGTTNVNVAGELSAGATTASTSTTTGALRSAGGLGVAGAGWFGSHVNTAGRFTSTLANDTATGGGQIFLNGANGNRIDYAAVGVAAPTFTTRSLGTKIVLYPALGVSAVDYAIGVENAAMWFSVNNSGANFRWYAGTANIATLTGTGQLGIGVTSVVASARLQVDSTTQGVLLTPMTQAQRLAIASPANGLIVTQTDGTSPGLWLFISGTWRAIALI